MSNIDLSLETDSDTDSILNSESEIESESEGDNIIEIIFDEDEKINEERYENIYMKENKNKYLIKKEIFEKDLLNKFKKEKDELDNNYQIMKESEIDNYINNLYKYLISYEKKNNYENFELDKNFENNILKIIEKNECLMYYYLKKYVLNDEVNENMKKIKNNNVCGILFRNDYFIEEYDVIDLVIFDRFEYIEPYYQNIMKNNFYMQFYHKFKYYFPLMDICLLETDDIINILKIQNINNETILHLFAKESITSKIVIILQKIFKKYNEIPVDLNLKDKDGNTFLMLIAKNSKTHSKRRKCLDVLNYLVLKNYQIKLDIENNNGETLLKIALKKKLYHLLSYLVTLKIDLNMSIFKNESHLKNLISYEEVRYNKNYIIIFTKLLENQTNEILKIPDVYDFYRELSLMGNKSSRYLLNNYPELLNNDMYYSLIKLFKYGDYSMFLKCIKKYPEYLNYIDENNKTLLINLLKLNKSYDDRGTQLNENGEKEISISYVSKMEQVINELLDYENINLSHIDNDGNNAYMYICRNNYLNIFLKINSKKGYDKNLKNKDGYHALYLNSLIISNHYVNPENLLISQFLIESYNYDLNIINEEGNNVIMNYIKNGNFNNINLIYKLFCSAILNNNYDIINHKNKQNENLLLLICKYLNNFEYLDKIMYNYYEKDNIKVESKEEKIEYILNYLKKVLILINSEKTKMNDNIIKNILLNILIIESDDLMVYKNDERNMLYYSKDLILTKLIYSLKGENQKKMLDLFLNELTKRNQYDIYLENILSKIHENYVIQKKIQKSKLKKVKKKNNNIDKIDYFIPFYYYDPTINFTEISLIYRLFLSNELYYFEKIFKKIKKIYEMNNIELINRIEYIELLRYILKRNEYLEIYFKYLNYDEINYYLKIIQKNKIYHNNEESITNNLYILERMKEKLYEKLLIETKKINISNDLILSMSEYIIDNSFYSNSKIEKNIKIMKKKIVPHEFEEDNE